MDNIIDLDLMQSEIPERVFTIPRDRSKLINDDIDHYKALQQHQYRQIQNAFMRPNLKSAIAESPHVIVIFKPDGDYIVTHTRSMFVKKDHWIYDTVLKKWFKYHSKNIGNAVPVEEDKVPKLLRATLSIIPL